VGSVEPKPKGQTPAFLALSSVSIASVLVVLASFLVFFLSLSVVGMGFIKDKERVYKR